MPSALSSIDVTNHAIDRYDDTLVGADERVRDEARSKIRDVIGVGAPPGGPTSWLPTVERHDDARRYVAFGPDRALVVNVGTGEDERDRMVVLTVIKQPGAVADDGAGVDS